jgi:hypothetical protein
MLMFPNPKDDLSNLVEILPGIEATEFEAAQWFSGCGRHAFTDSPTDGAASARARTEYQKNTRPLELARMISQWRERLYEVVIPIGGETTEEQIRFKAHCEERIEALQDELRAASHGDD